MTESLPITYLLVLIVLLGGASWFILRQAFKTRNTELTLVNLQRKLAQGPGSPEDYYELGSILLNKKLYAQSILQFQKALKSKDLESGELAGLIYNALGYGYAAQEQYDLALRQYKEALKCAPDYVVALKNMGFAYERKQLVSQAIETYEQVLTIAPNDAVAQKRLDSLKKRMVESGAS